MHSLSDILEDYTHGSTYLAKLYLELIIKKKPDRDELNNMKNQILSRFDDMQIFHYIHEELEKSSSIQLSATTLLEQLTRSGKILANKLRQLIGENAIILTISYSKAVVDTLHNMSYQLVYCMESLPGGEGKHLVADLDNSQIIRDDLIQTVLDDVDAVIFGCDQFDDHYIVNKIGTKKLVNEVQSYGVPIFVLTSEFKYTIEVDKKISDPMLEVFEREIISEVITDRIES